GPALAQPGNTPPAGGPGAAPQGPVAGDAPAPDAPRLPLSPDELALLSEVERDYVRYREAAEGHHLRIRAIVRRELDKRTRDLERRYAERIRKADDERKKRHLDTIALLETFIAEHPDHEQFTPDAMFRLASLYLDQAEAELEARE